MYVTSGTLYSGTCLGPEKHTKTNLIYLEHDVWFPCHGRPPTLNLKDHSYLVTLHRYECIYPETCVRSAISSVCYYVVLIEISVIAWWSHGMTISALLAFDFVRRIKRSPLESVHKKWPMLMSARTSQNGGDWKRLNCNRWHGTASVLVRQPLDSWTDVLVKVSKLLRQKVSRAEGDSNPQPLRVDAECSNHLNYQGQTFCVPDFNICSGGKGTFVIKLAFEILSMCGLLLSFRLTNGCSCENVELFKTENDMNWLEMIIHK